METREHVIQPDRSWLHIPWRELWEYRDLLGLLVRRNFVATYKQTVLGPAWYVINPLTQTLIFTVIFGHLAKLSTDGMPKPLFYLCGMLGWGYFSRCIGSTSSALAGNASLFGKVYFPRLVMPISEVATGLIGFLIQLVTFLGFWVYFNFFTPAGRMIQMRLAVLLLPLLLVQCAAMGMGVGLWVSSLTAKYRDFTHLTSFLVRFWMYATPLVYPLSMLPDRWKWASGLNPMTPVLESFRLAFLGVGVVQPWHVVWSLTATALLLLSGMAVFSRTERTFIDTV